MEIFIGQTRCKWINGILSIAMLQYPEEHHQSGIFAKGDTIAFGKPGDTHSQPMIGDQVIVLKERRKANLHFRPNNPYGCSMNNESLPKFSIFGKIYLIYMKKILNNGGRIVGDLAFYSKPLSREISNFPRRWWFVIINTERGQTSLGIITKIF